MVDVLYGIGALLDVIGIIAVVKVTRQAIRMNVALRKMRGGYNVNQRAFDPSQFHAPSIEDLK